VADTREMKAAYGRRYARIAKRAADDMVKRLKDDAPVGKDPRKPGGTLQRSIVATPKAQRGVRIVYAVGPRVDYASFTNEGADEHPIVARNAPLLVFPWDRGPRGPGIYAFPRVKHPGQEGTQWFTKAIKEWPDAIRQAARSEVTT
jgi:hypothetical protein